MFQLAVISDEVSQDLDTVIEFAQRFRLTGIEVRSLWDKGPFDFSPADVEKIRRKTAEAGLAVPCIGSPFFKCDIGDEAAAAAHLEGLKRCIDAALALGAPLIRGFSFWKKGNLPLAAVAERFAPVVPLLESAGLTLVLEPDPAVNTPNGRTLAQLLGLIGSPRVAALWDPGNIIFDDAGERPYPDGYEAVKPYLRHMHLKDARRVDGAAQAVAVGTGEVDMAGQFARLLADGYSGWVSLETHYRLARTISEESMRLPSGSGFSEGGYAASADCLAHFYRLLEREVPGALPQAPPKG